MLLPGLAGVLWMEGEAWTERRRALNPVFHHQTFAHYARWMHETAEEAVGSWYVWRTSHLPLIGSYNPKCEWRAGRKVGASIWCVSCAN